MNTKSYHFLFCFILKTRIIVTIFLLFSFSFLAAQNYIVADDSWKYLDDGSNQGTAWTAIAFDDSSWAQGNAELGYGDTQNTVISYGPDSSNKYPTSYFRKTFNVTDASAYDFLEMQAIRDDGIAVYLNGSLVWSDNMPTSWDYLSYANSTISSTGETTWLTQTISNSLIVGQNVIAVEIHQANATSSDVSFNFKLTGITGSDANVVRGPYLQKGTPNSMVVKWRTSVPTESIVNYGTALGNLNQSNQDLTLKTEHQIEITGLSSNTIYYYDIANSAGVIIPESSDQSFKTHPIVGTTNPYTFWILGDAGTADSNQRAVRNAYYSYIGSNHTDGILFLGDNAYNSGTDSEYQYAMFENMYEDKLKNTIAWSTLGNHDGYTADSATQTGPYYDIFTFPTSGESGGMASGTEAYYSFDYGNIHFIVLDSYETNRSVGAAMYNWAQSDIQNTTQEWIVAFWHHPPYTKGSHDSDTEGNLIDMRQNFLPMLESNGVDLVLAGHSHSYERSYFLNGHYGDSNTFSSTSHTVGVNGDGDGKIDGNGAYAKLPSETEGAVYITTGSAGKISGGSLDHEAMYYSVNQFGSCVLEVDGGILNVKFIRETGVIEDYFTIEKSNCEVGTSCDDGDPCTTNDVYDVDCNCVGTPDTNDTDNDGVCDSVDQEINSPCPNDVDSNGVSIDTDGDGYADCIDSEPNSPCPNDVDSNGVSLDSDGDGVLDCNDICPGGNDNEDSDGDGIPDFCDSSNCIPDNTTFSTSTLTHSGSGSNNTSATIPVDGQDISFTVSGLDQRTGGKPSKRYIEEVTITYVDELGSNQTYGVFTASTGSTVNVSVSGIVQTVTVSLADGYDGNSSTNMSVNLSQVGYCIETVQCQDSDGDGVCDSEDVCPGFDDNLDIDGDTIPDGCDPCNDLIDSDGDGVSDCIDQEINSPCPNNVDANGISLDTDGDGVCDDNDICPGFDDAIDTDGDSVPDGCDLCEGFNDADDDDNDGIPNGCDPCDDNIIGTSCDDGDDCTINDVYVDCDTCQGTYTDADGDGYCVGDDPDDNDGCNPDPNSSACNTCNEITSQFPNNPLSHSGSGSSTTIISYANNQTDVVFTISNLDERTGGKPTNRYIDIVDVNYVDSSGSTQLYGTFSGENVSSVNISIVEEIQSISVTLREGYDGSSNTTLSVSFSDVTSCEIGNPAKQILSEETIKIYPNPVKDKLNIEITDSNNTISRVLIYNVFGRLIKEKSFSQKGKTSDIYLNNIISGLYFLEIENSQGQIIKRQRIIKN